MRRDSNWLRRGERLMTSLLRGPKLKVHVDSITTMGALWTWHVIIEPGSQITLFLILDTL